MPTFKLPLSGDVVQSINPFTAFMTGGQFGLININMGQSSEPKVEEEVLSDVASYGNSSAASATRSSCCWRISSRARRSAPRRPRRSTHSRRCWARSRQ